MKTMMCEGIDSCKCSWHREQRNEVKWASRHPGESRHLLFPAINVSWHENAKCVTEGKELDFFFPEDPENDNGRASAKQVAVVASYCSDCPVKEPCLTVGQGQQGIWGGQQKRFYG